MCCAYGAGDSVCYGSQPLPFYSAPLGFARGRPFETQGKQGRPFGAPFIFTLPAPASLASRESSSILSNQLDHHPASNHGRRPLQAGKSDVVFGIKEPVHLGAAGLEQGSHLIFGYFLFLHGLVELPCDDFLDRLRLRLFKDTLALQEVINARTYVIPALLALLVHRFNSF